MKILVAVDGSEPALDAVRREGEDTTQWLEYAAEGLLLTLERVWQRDYANHAEATSDIADYIVSFYNSVRLHSKLGNLPPNAFEQQSAINQPIGVCEIT